MRRKLVMLGVLCLPFLVGCHNNTPQKEGSRRISELCDNEHQCVSGLVCDDGLCRQVCEIHEDCPNDYKCENGACVPGERPAPTGPSEKNLGERCDNDQNKCVTGLTCESGICKKSCSSASDCNQDTEECDPDKKVCVKKADAVGLGIPAGGSLTNIAGTTKSADGHYEVKVLGGSMSGVSQGENTKVQANEGSWK